MSARLDAGPLIEAPYWLLREAVQNGPIETRREVLDALIRLAKDIMQRDADASEDVTRFYLAALSLRSEYPA